jgi:hypothetical protein
LTTNNEMRPRVVRGVELNSSLWMGVIWIVVIDDDDDDDDGNVFVIVSFANVIVGATSFFRFVEYECRVKTFCFLSSFWYFDDCCSCCSLYLVGLVVNVFCVCKYRYREI